MVEVTPESLETQYTRLLSSARRARAWAEAKDAALAAGDREAAADHLTRYWAAVRTARRHLHVAWPGLEIFARRTIAARWPQACEAQVERTLVAVRQRLSNAPPAAMGIPGLYGCLRRLVRDEGEAVGGRLGLSRSGRSRPRGKS